MQSTTQTILLTIGIILAIEGILLALFTKTFQKTLKQINKTKTLRNLGIAETIFAIILILLAILS